MLKKIKIINTYENFWINEWTYWSTLIINLNSRSKTKQSFLTNKDKFNLYNLNTNIDRTKLKLTLMWISINRIKFIYNSRT